MPMEEFHHIRLIWSGALISSHTTTILTHASRDIPQPLQINVRRVNLKVKTANLKTFNLQEPCVLYIGRAYSYPPGVAFIVFFSTNISTEYFKHAAHSPFFSS